MAGKLVCRKEVCFNAVIDKTGKVLKNYEFSCDVIFIDHSNPLKKSEYREDVQVGLMGIATIWKLKKGFTACFALPFDRDIFGKNLYARMSSYGKDVYVYKTLGAARKDILTAFEKWNVSLSHKFNKDLKVGKIMCTKQELETDVVAASEINVK